MIQKTHENIDIETRNFKILYSNDKSLILYLI